MIDRQVYWVIVGAVVSLLLLLALALVLPRGGVLMSRAETRSLIWPCVALLAVVVVAQHDGTLPSHLLAAAAAVVVLVLSIWPVGWYLACRRKGKR